MKEKSAKLILTGFLAASFFQQAAFAAEKDSDQALAKRGEYLVNFGGCNDCHTPKIMTPDGRV